MFSSKSKEAVTVEDRDKVDKEDIYNLTADLAVGKIERVKKMFSSKKTRDKISQLQEKSGKTLLHLAIPNYNSFAYVLSEYVKLGWDVNEEDTAGYTPLARVAEKGDERLLKQLLESGAKADSKATQLFCSNFCSLNCESLLLLLISRGASANPATVEEKTPLHCAVLNTRENKLEDLVGSLLMIELLLKFGAHINTPNSQGDTALHWAIYRGRIDIIKYLLAKGAHMSIKGREGLTAIELVKAHLSIDRTRYSEIMAVVQRSQDLRKFFKLIEFDPKEPKRDVRELFVMKDIEISDLQLLTADILRTQLGLKSNQNIERIITAARKFTSAPSSRIDPSSAGNSSSRAGGASATAASTSVSSAKPSKADLLAQPGTRVSMSLKEPPASLRTTQRLSHVEVLGTKSSGSRISRPGPASLRKEVRVEEKKLLSLRKKIYGLQTKSTIPDDVHSQFAAVSDQLFDTISQSNDIRKNAAQWLLKNANFPLPNGSRLCDLLVDTDWKKYCEKIEVDAPGDELTLLAISNHYNAKIFLVTYKLGEDFLTEVLPDTGASATNTLYLCVSSNHHYQSLTHRSSAPLVPYLSIDPSELIFDPAEKPIGLGAQGRVYKAIWRTTPVAVKKINPQFQLQQEELKTFEHELSMYRRFNSPYVVLFMGASLRANTQMLVFEYMTEGSLYDLLRSKERWQKRLQENASIRYSIAKDIANGMAFLHNFIPPIIHCDLTSKNILLDEKLTAKISDLGLSRFKSNDLVMNGHCWWAAPEVLRKDKNFGPKVDVYSYGIILWELWTNLDPGFMFTSYQEFCLATLRKAYRPELFASIPAQWRDLIARCWHEDPQKRPSFEYIKSHMETDLRELELAPSQPPATSSAQRKNKGSKLVRQSSLNNATPKAETQLEDTDGGYLGEGVDFTSSPIGNSISPRSMSAATKTSNQSVLDLFPDDFNSSSTLGTSPTAVAPTMPLNTSSNSSTSTISSMSHSGSSYSLSSAAMSATPPANIQSDVPLLPRRIRLLDGSIKEVQLDLRKSVADTLQTICQKFNVKEEVTLFDESTQMDLNVNEPLFRQTDSSSLLQLKKKFGFDESNPQEVHMRYIQCKDRVLSGRLTTTYTEVCYLAALELSLILGDVQKELYWAKGCLRDQIRMILPPSWRKNKYIEKDILLAWKKLETTADVILKLKYVQFCVSLKLYGVDAYEGKEIDGKGRKTPMILGLTKNAIMKIHYQTKEVLRTFSIYQLKRWTTHNNDGVLWLDFGVWSNHFLRFQSDETPHISNTISQVIEDIAKKELIAAPDGQTKERSTTSSVSLVTLKESEKSKGTGRSTSSKNLNFDPPSEKRNSFSDTKSVSIAKLIRLAGGSDTIVQPPQPTVTPATSLSLSNESKDQTLSTSGGDKVTPTTPTSASSARSTLHLSGAHSGIVHSANTKDLLHQPVVVGGSSTAPFPTSTSSGAVFSSGSSSMTQLLQPNPHRKSLGMASSSAAPLIASSSSPVPFSGAPPSASPAPSSTAPTAIPTSGSGAASRRPPPSSPLSGSSASDQSSSPTNPRSPPPRASHLTLSTATAQRASIETLSTVAAAAAAMSSPATSNAAQLPTAVVLLSSHKVETRRLKKLGLDPSNPSLRPGDSDQQRRLEEDFNALIEILRAQPPHPPPGTVSDPVGAEEKLREGIKSIAEVTKTCQMGFSGLRHQQPASALAIIVCLATDLTKAIHAISNAANEMVHSEFLNFASVITDIKSNTSNIDKSPNAVQAAKEIARATAGIISMAKHAAHSSKVNKPMKVELNVCCQTVITITSMLAASAKDIANKNRTSELKLALAKKDLLRELERLQSVADVIRGNVPAHHQLRELCASLCTTCCELLEAVRAAAVGLKAALSSSSGAVGTAAAPPIVQSPRDTDPMDKIPFLIEDLESDVAQLMTTLQTSEEFREWSDAIESIEDIIGDLDAALIAMAAGLMVEHTQSDEPILDAMTSAVQLNEFVARMLASIDRRDYGRQQQLSSQVTDIMGAVANSVKALIAANLRREAVEERYRSSSLMFNEDRLNRAKDVGMALLKLLRSMRKFLADRDSNPENRVHTVDCVKKVRYALANLLSAVDVNSSDEDELLDKMTEEKLLFASQAVENACLRMPLIQDHVTEAIKSALAMTKAASNVLKAATVVQRESIKRKRLSMMISPSNRGDSAWNQGLMSAAFAVAHVVEGFVTAVREHAVQRSGREQLLQHAEHVRREVGRVVTAAKGKTESSSTANSYLSDATTRFKYAHNMFLLTLELQDQTA